MILVVATLRHFIVVSIKPPLVICCYCFSVSIAFILIIVSLGNTRVINSFPHMYLVISKTDSVIWFIK